MSTADYIVYVRHNGYAFVKATTSSYEDAHNRARQCGGEVMFRDHFHATYKSVEIAQHYNGFYEVAGV